MQPEFLAQIVDVERQRRCTVCRTSPYARLRRRSAHFGGVFPVSTRPHRTALRFYRTLGSDVNRGIVLNESYKNADVYVRMTRDQNLIHPGVC